MRTKRFTKKPAWLADSLVGAVAALGPLALYALTLPRTVVLEDDSLFLMAGEHLGVAHPPGYPLYTLICHLFMQLPFGSPALLGHLSSAALGALACAGVYACARLLGASRLPGLVAAWLFGASEHFWSQAIIAEVYTLNAALFFAAFALILHGVRQPGRIWPWAAAAAAYGLSLANHWPLMVLAAPGLALAAWPALPRIPRRLPLLALIAFVCASLPYVWMVLRSWQEPPISFYGPLEDWGAFWHYFSRSGYEGVDESLGAGWLDRLAYLWWFVQQLAWQLTLPGFALAGLGLWRMLRGRRVAREDRVAGWGGALVLLGNSVLLVFLLGFDFDARNLSVFRPYSLVCYGIAAVWLALGAQWLLDRWAPTAAPWLKLGATALAGAGMVAQSLWADWTANDRSGSHFAERHARLMFDLLPADAVLFLFDDEEVGPLGYYHFVEGRRPDLSLLSTQGLVFGNRLFSWRQPRREQQAALRRFLAGTDRPVFYSVGEEEFPHGLGVRHWGFAKEAVRNGQPGLLELRLHPGSDAYFEELLDMQPIDAWERFRRDKLLFAYGEYLGYVALGADPELNERVGGSMQRADGSFFALMGMAEVLLAHGDATHLALVEGWLRKAEGRQEEIMTKERRARFLYLQGFCTYRLGRAPQARALFEASRAIYPHPENAAIAALRQIGR